MTSEREIFTRAVRGLTYRSVGDDDGGPGPLQPTRASRRIDELLAGLAEMKAERDKHEGLSSLRSNALDSALGRVAELEAAISLTADIGQAALEEVRAERDALIGGDLIAMAKGMRQPHGLDRWRVGDVEVRVSSTLVVLETRRHPVLTPSEARDLCIAIGAAAQTADKGAR